MLWLGCAVVVSLKDFGLYFELVEEAFTPLSFFLFIRVPLFAHVFFIPYWSETFLFISFQLCCAEVIVVFLDKYSNSREDDVKVDLLFALVLLQALPHPRGILVSHVALLLPLAPTEGEPVAGGEVVPGPPQAHAGGGAKGDRGGQVSVAGAVGGHQGGGGEEVSDRGGAHKVSLEQEFY